MKTERELQLVHQGLLLLGLDDISVLMTPWLAETCECFCELLVDLGLGIPARVGRIRAQ